MVSESKGLNPLVALKREQANFLNFTIKIIYIIILSYYYLFNKMKRRKKIAIV